MTGIKKIESDVFAILTTLNQVNTIAGPDDYTRCADLLKQGKDIIKAIDDAHNDDIEFAHKEHKRLVAERDRIKKPVEDATKRVKAIMGNWKDEQERIRRQEQARLESEARKAEEERKIREALEAEKTGDKAKAEQIINEPIMVAPVVLPKAVTGGPTFREVWKFRIVNSDLIPRQYLTPDEKAIGGVVRSLKGQCQIPGVEVYSEKV